jgi:hypothetical protein
MRSARSAIERHGFIIDRRPKGLRRAIELDQVDRDSPDVPGSIHCREVAPVAHAIDVQIDVGIFCKPPNRSEPK